MTQLIQLMTTWTTRTTLPVACARNDKHSYEILSLSQLPVVSLYGSKVMHLKKPNIFSTSRIQILLLTYSLICCDVNYLLHYK